jgi:MFS family permease
MAPVRWEEERRIPRSVAAVMTGLRFSGGAGSVLRGLSERDWDPALRFCDRAQLTLLAGHLWSEYLPGSVRARIDRNRRSNALRDTRMRAALCEIAACLNARGIAFLVLKGYSHGPQYGPAGSLRPQYDIDLYVQPETLTAARDALLSLDYEPLRGVAGFATDHLPAMVRKTGWQWRGDFFDPDIPPSVDIHFRLWNRHTERFDAPGVEEFWERRAPFEIDGVAAAALDEADKLCYASLHALRHLLRGSLRVYHVYEIAHFLDRMSGEEDFWQRRASLHPPELRTVQATLFLLARRWFACRLPDAVREEAASLPAGVPLWMVRHAAAPVRALFHPDKAELWLHLSMLTRASDKAAVLRRRLMPLRPPGHVDSVFVAEKDMTPWLRIRRNARYAAHAAGRALHHTRAILPAAAQGVSWALGGSRPFFTFLLGANLYNLGVFIFFLLYNLLLLDLGFDERFIGVVTGAMTAGTIAGTLPAAALARRHGLQRLMTLACAAMPLLLCARALLTSPAAMMASAFAGGVCSAFWFVCLPPVVARLTAQHRRPLGFSLWLASGIATGIVGGLAGSRLPAWIASAGLAAGAPAKQLAIVAGCVLTAAALWPLSKMRVPRAAVPEPRIYPRSPFVVRFLLIFAVWQLAIGAFNPFFNVYFSRELKLPLEQIGVVFAGSQCLQAAAVLLAPLALKRLGLAGGVAGFQAATAACLVLIAASASPAAAALLYAAYMSFQAMAEPGLFTMLLNRAGASEQGGASALLFLVMFSCHAVAAPLAGAALAMLGYGRLLQAAALLALLAALLCRLALSQRGGAREAARALAAD